MTPATANWLFGAERTNDTTNGATGGLTREQNPESRLAGWGSGRGEYRTEVGRVPARLTGG